MAFAIFEAAVFGVGSMRQRSEQEICSKEYVRVYDQRKIGTSEIIREESGRLYINTVASDGGVSQKNSERWRGDCTKLTSQPSA